MVCVVTGSGLTQKLMVTTIPCGTSGDRSLRAARWESMERESEAAVRKNTASSAETGWPAQILLHCSLAVQMLTSISLSKLRIIEKFAIMD